jgi:hypothetical protein
MTREELRERIREIQTAVCLNTIGPATGVDSMEALFDRFEKEM